MSITIMKIMKCLKKYKLVNFRRSLISRKQWNNECIGSIRRKMRANFCNNIGTNKPVLIRY